jgi:hypothetical protein
MANTESTTIMIVDLSVDSTRQTQFDNFYQDFYIPEFLKAVPEIVSARRYAHPDILDAFDQVSARFLTIYELASDNAIDNIEKAISRSAHQKASDQFKVWKKDGLTNFSRAFYREVYRHPRQETNGCWGNHSLYAFEWAIKPDFLGNAIQWYVDEYVDTLMSNMPSLLACRIYLSMKFDFCNFLTIFEVAKLEPSADFSNEALPDAWRVAYRNWVEQALAQHSTLTLKPIYFIARNSL